MKHHVIGIDPGMDGAIALLCHEKAKIKSVEVWLMPTIWIVTASKKNRRITDHRGLVKLMDEEISDRENLAGVIERVQAMPADAAVTAINYGENYGALKMLLTAFNVSFVTVRPAGWKRELQLTKDKEKSLLFFKNNIPKKFHEVVGTNHNKAEAVILAWLGLHYQTRLSALSEL